jgi:mono/diheme cytochrome c family protein
VQKTKMKSLGIFFTAFVFCSLAFSHTGEIRGRFQPDPSKSDDWNLGAMLAKTSLKCAQCHGKREKPNEFNVNATLSGWHGTNITQNKKNGIGSWTIQDLEYYFETGMKPNGDFSGGEMGEFLAKTKTLSKSERHALAVYIKSLPAAETTREPSMHKQKVPQERDPELINNNVDR